ncbi:MAG: hypothetical protein R3281_04515 [Balneolaceae bacterium]|nr:hypothetical protein [Balneolaceae bacterium]
MAELRNLLTGIHGNPGNVELLDVAVCKKLLYCFANVDIIRNTRIYGKVH